MCGGVGVKGNIDLGDVRLYLHELQLTGDALKKSEARNQALLTAIPDLVFHMNGDGTFLECRARNPGDLFVNLDQFPGKKVGDVLPPALAELTLKHVQWALQTGDVQLYEYSLPIDGVERAFEARAVVYAENEAIVIVREITERRRNEQALQRRDATLLATLRISEAAHSAKNLDNLYRSIHDIISELMPARNFYIALYDDQTDQISFPYFVDECDHYSLVAVPRAAGRGLTEYVLRTGQPLLASPETFEILCKSGEAELHGAASIDWLGVPLKTQEKTIGVLAVQSYTTGVRFCEEHQNILVFVSTQVAMAIERMQSEDALRMSKERYRSVIENIPIGVYRNTPGPRGEFLMANPAFLSMFGYQDFQELKEVTVADLYVYPEEREQFSAYLLKNESVTGYELRLKKRDGTPLWGSVTARVIHGETAGDIVYFDCAIEDISERKMREQEQEVIINVAAALRTATDQTGMHSIILGHVIDLLKIDTAALVLCDLVNNTAQVVYALGNWSHLRNTQIKQCENTLWNLGIGDRPDRENNLNQEISPFDGFPKAAFIPLTAQDKTIGVLCLGCHRPLSGNEMHIVSAISDMAANAIHRSTLHEKTSIQVQRLAALRAVDIAISASMDLRVTLSVLLEQIIGQLNTDAAVVSLLNKQTHIMEVLADRGFRTNLSSKFRVRLGDGPAGRAALERRTVHLTNLREDAPYFLQERMLSGENFACYFGIPLTAKGQLLGLLEVFQRSPFTPDREWVEFLEALAGQAAIAIDNATLFRGLQRSNMELCLAYDTTLEGWVHALDLRDKETEGHTQRVTEMTLHLARSMGKGNGELVHIQRGALLHDIGKMAIPDSILQKPGPLTEGEWVIMRRHPVYAYDWLYPITYLRPVMEIPYCHHEKWDGSGYPRGLCGEQIPLAARIFAIVDVWDALRTERTYRKAWPDAQVIEYLREQAGYHFDPVVTEVFLRLLESDEKKNEGVVGQI